VGSALREFIETCAPWLHWCRVSTVLSGVQHIACCLEPPIFPLFLPKESVDLTIKPLEVVLVGPQEDAAARIDEQGRSSDERLDDIDLNGSATADPTAQSGSDLAQQQQDGAQNAAHNAAHTCSSEQPASVLVRYPYSRA
jgi:hypothetical protein